MDRALQSFASLSPQDQDSLQTLLETFGMFAVPRQSNVRQLLIGTARHRLLDQAAPFLEEMKVGIPQAFHDTFWSVLTLPAIEFLFQQQLPTPDKVANVIQPVEEHVTQEQLNCLYYLKQFITRLDQDELGLFLHFVTGSSVLPEKIAVSFNQLAGELRRPIVHTCTNTLELSTSYSSPHELKREFMNILNNTLCF